MTDLELRDMAERAATAAMQMPSSVPEMLIREEAALTPVHAGHHGFFEGSGLPSPGAPGRFELSVEDGEPPRLDFENKYYDVGGRTYDTVTVPVIGRDFTGFVALRIPMTGDDPAAEIVTFESFGQMREAQRGMGAYILPLYQLGRGSVVCDFRVGPPAVAGEFSA